MSASCRISSESGRRCPTSSSPPWERPVRGEPSARRIGRGAGAPVRGFPQGGVARDDYERDGYGLGAERSGPDVSCAPDVLLRGSVEANGGIAMTDLTGK